jgi:hypothetical protein
MINDCTIVFNGKALGFHDNLHVAKAREIQSLSVKAAVVVIYCQPLATPELDSSGLPTLGFKQTENDL